MLTRLLHRRV